MKKIHFIPVILAVLFILFSSSTVFGKETVTPKKVTIQKNTIASLLVGINSDNLGLRTSAAYMLGELKSDEALIPLLRMLKSDECDEAKMMAALSLYKLGDNIGMYAIYRASKFDDCEKLRKLCSMLYYEFTKQNLTQN